MEVVIFIGLQASGKTTFFRERFSDTHVHVSKDNFRNHKRPARRQERELRAALEAGRSVVVDNTNPTREDRAAIMLLAKEYGARVIGYSFDSDIDRCLERNAKREGVACVSTVGFYATVKRFERPSADEGFDELLSSRFTESRFEKPFDPLFRDHMVKAAMALMESLTGLYAYTESDEISLLLPREWDHFDREVEKIVSLAAGTASAAFTHSVGEPATFDGRIWVGAQDQTVVDYFLWCQFDATRCCLNGWSYWTLRKEGWTVADATKELEGKNSPWKQEMLFQRGINFNDLPTWQKRGIGIRNAEETRTGVDPRNGEEVEAIRRTLTIDDELPMTESYASYVRALLSDPKTT